MQMESSPISVGGCAAGENSMSNPLKLKRINHVELWVGNAKQAAYYYRKAFGFSQKAYSGLESGKRNATSYLLDSGRANLMLTTPMEPEGEMQDHIKLHGDGVHDIAFEVEDCDAAFKHATANGAEAYEEPHDEKDEHGVIRRAAIRTYGDTIHSLISYKDYDGPFLPGFVAATIEEEDFGLRLVDHIVGNVELGKMEYWADWYSKVLGFERYITFDDKDISTEYSALMSIVMSDEGHKVKFPLNEPAEGKKKSQFEEFLEFYHGPGAQHVALLTTDIITTITKMKRAGVEFLEVPGTYYDELTDRVGEIDENLQRIRDLGILVDRDEDGYLLQLFTKPVQDRPTMFYEVIQRKGSRGFGKGNFKALFEAIEREQARRGNL
jgi:4-hydroxyphenylpyruvate dioxygenase